MAGIIVAGWDKKNGGRVYTIPLGGTLIRQPFSIGGFNSFNYRIWFYLYLWIL